MWESASVTHRLPILAILRGMSTLDPGLEPPGDWQSSYPPVPGGPGGGSGGGGPTEATGKAAVYVWLCAGLSLAMSCCCVLSAIGMKYLPKGELMRQVPADMPNRDMIEQVLPMMAVAMGVAGVLLLLIPAVVLGVLGFTVRSGNRGAAIASMVILGIQGAAIGLLVVMNLIGSLVSRSAGDLLGVVILAGVFAVYVKAMTALWSSLSQKPHSGLPPAGPWGA